jgi:hypothetical protein
MTDPPSDPVTRPETADDNTRGGHPGLPRWVKASGIIVVILVIALIVIMLVAGGDHGPRRHATGNQATEQTWHGAPGDAPFAIRESADRG